MTLEFSRQIFENFSNIKFPENPPSGSRVVPCGRTDGHNEANSSSLQFCERASKSGMKCTGMQHSQWYWGTADWIHRVRFMSEARMLLLTTENITVLGQTQWDFLKGDSVSNRSPSSSCMPDHEFTDIRMYRPFTSFWHVKTLSELADGPSMYVKWRGEGVLYFVSSANPLSVWLNRDSLFAFRLKMSWTRT